MISEAHHFALSCTDDASPPVLTGVQAHGRLDAVLLDLTVRQTYRNTSDRTLEVVYTFPLPPQAVLLGFASELNGARQDGVIVAAGEAERQYEESLEQGDAPVMLEAHGEGLYTANLGNLKPGDVMVLEARFAQLLAFDQGRLRVSIPTTIAPHYGYAGQAGLQPQQAPVASLDADYPLTLTLTIGAALADARIECPTHRLALSRGTDGTALLDLAAGARLDRDVVVVVTPFEPQPSLLVRADNAFDPAAPVVTLAALQPPAGVPRERITLKLLVDCSGSMVGDSIASARAALRGVVAGLTERDQLSLSRFGSHVEHLFAPAPAKPQALRHLAHLIDGIEADLGGTEMRGALDAVFALGRGTPQGGGDVLLITDGEVWRTEEMVAAARASGHRVFAIGVGSAPAEGVLRTLAESTGGACELATPGEALEAAARRMLHRMRQPVYTNVRIDWGGTPAWSSAPSPCVFGGDTVIAFAGFDTFASAGVTRLLADDAQGTTVELARCEADLACPGDSLPRIAAARRIAQVAGADADADAAALALRYQLLTRHTHCILVHQRADADKATEQARLHRVSSMLAAGWGGFGSVGHDVRAHHRVASLSASASYSLEMSTDYSLNDDGSRDPVDIESLMRRVHRKSIRSSLGLTALECIAREVGDQLAAGVEAPNLAPACAGGVSLPQGVQQALDEVVQLGLSVDQAWVLLAHWVYRRTRRFVLADLSHLLAPWMAQVDPALIAASAKVFQRLLGGYPVSDRNLSRKPSWPRAPGRVGA